MKGMLALVDWRIYTLCLGMDMDVLELFLLLFLTSSRILFLLLMFWYGWTRNVLLSLLLVMVTFVYRYGYEGHRTIPERTCPCSLKNIYPLFRYGYGCDRTVLVLLATIPDQFEESIPFVNVLIWKNWKCICFHGCLS